MPRWSAAPPSGRPGCGPGGPDGPFHVALMLDNVPEFVFWLEAAALAGAVVVGANPTHRGDELVRDLTHTECQFLVTDSTYLPLVEGSRIGDTLGTVEADNARVLVLDTDAAQAELAAHAGTRPAEVAEPSVTPETLGYLLFTSGTSGAPKACLCSQGRLARIGAIVAQMYALTPEDVCYLSMPLFHSNALMAGWGPALMAGSAFALPSSGRFSASGFLPDVRAAGATYFNYVGKPLSYILATPEQPDDADNPLVRAFGNEGSADDVARFAERFGCRRHRLLRLHRGRRHGRPDPRHATGRAGSGPGGNGGARPRHRRGVPDRPLRREGPAAQCGGGDRRARVQGRGRGLRGLLAQRRRRDRPACARGGTGRATWPTATKRASSTSPGATTTGSASTARTSRPRRSSGSSNATPTSCSPRSTPCPTRSWATRSWPPCSSGPASMRSTPTASPTS